MEKLIEIYIGKNSIDHIEAVSKMRIDMFKEYPYLYKGELDYEKKYMQGYADDDRSMIAIAKVNGVLAGVSTGIPLASESEIVAEAKNEFIKKKININPYYYYGEIMVLPQYRGQGITSKLYSAQDEIIKSWGYKHACILTVVREEDHPLKPINYKTTDKLFESLGFVKNNLTIMYNWPTIQADTFAIDVDNKLEFWIKDLSDLA